MNTDRAILDFQQECYCDYANDLHELGLPESYTYPDGNPIRPLPPLKTACNGLMIIGAYPSARFEYRRSHKNPRRRRLIPIADNLQPFGYEQYFDGLRKRTLLHLVKKSPKSFRVKSLPRPRIFCTAILSAPQQSEIIQHCFCLTLMLVGALKSGVLQ